MGDNPAVHSELVENEHGIAFEVESGLGNGLTLWFERSEWGHEQTRGRIISVKEARELAHVLERMAQKKEALSHSN
jgi:hypothetical protein